MESRFGASDEIKYVGMWLNYSLTMRKQVATVCSMVARNISLIRMNRKCLSIKSCQKLASGLVMGLLDYGNTLYYGLPNKEVTKLQRLQNYATKTILGRNKYGSSTLARHQLHWLPVEERIKFKPLTLVYKCLNDQEPLYLQKLLEYQRLDKKTRSSGNRLLKIPKSKWKTFLDRSFAVSGLKLWNKLPDAIKKATTLKEFKKVLKTHLFNQAYYSQW